MILYCDTSSLVKLYVEEDRSRDVHTWVREADMVATCRVALPEMVSALTRRFNKHDLDQQRYELLLHSVRHDWRHIVALDIDEQLAADLAQRHGLRGYDAVHLACAVRLAATEGISMLFSAFDAHLVRAATTEGLTVLR
jgi:predicted nucleic acid-binding protein